MIKTRFAPSPTGFLHIGSLRTALFAYLFAKNQGGQFLLRVEDTDRERFIKGSIENMLHSLCWAGIAPDEGFLLDEDKNIIQKGENQPYIQSERLEIYQHHVNELVEQGHAYYCFCSKHDLEKMRQEQQKNKQPTGYDGRCSKLSAEERNQLISTGQDRVVRLKIPREGTTKFFDLVRGEVEFKNNLIDDQVLLKADGFPTYHLAVVVDDHLMNVTHVIRGEEWLPSTPKHVQLYKMFNWDIPQYAHLSLLINEQKQKLSKRHGDVSVRDYIDKGYLPEALINFIAFLGWNPGDEREIFSLKELEKEFAFDKVSKAAAVFNLEKLDWYNAQYIRSMDLDELTDLCKPFLINAGLIDEQTEWLKKVVALEKDRMVKLSDLPEAVGFVFADQLEYDSELLIWKKSIRKDIEKNLRELKRILSEFNKDWNKDGLEKMIINWIKESELTNGEVLWPMRVALSGLKNSPGPFEIADVLGKEKTIQRIELAIKKFCNSSYN